MFALGLEYASLGLMRVFCTLADELKLKINSTQFNYLDTEPSSENTWIPMLVVVALVSAMLGAVLMITALKCRRYVPFSIDSFT